MVKLNGDGPVVLVDDDEADTDIMRRFFGRSRLASTHEFLSFESGMTFFEHMDLVAEGSRLLPSIVLLDINMPVMDGFEVLERLRSMEPFAEVPAVVFVSNTDRSADVKLAEGLRAAFREKFNDIETGVSFFDSLVLTPTGD